MTTTEREEGGTVTRTPTAAPRYPDTFIDTASASTPGEPATAGVSGSARDNAIGSSPMTGSVRTHARPHGAPWGSR